MNAKVDTVITLEWTFYHQGVQTVDNYLNSFQVLVSNIEYTNSWTLVVKFCHGLRISIQNQIATMSYRCLSDTDLEA